MNAASDARCPSALKLNYISERINKGSARMYRSRYDETLGGGDDVEWVHNVSRVLARKKTYSFCIYFMVPGIMGRKIVYGLCIQKKN